MRKRKRLISDESFIPQSACQILGIEEVQDLKGGMDFRKPEYRREVFLRFYAFHLKYKSHPGAVYYLMPWLSDKLSLTQEQKLWLAFINGCTQNLCTTWVIFNVFPDFSSVTEDSLETWHRQYWKRLDYDIDKRYSKGHFVENFVNYKKNLGGLTQEQFFFDKHGSNTPEENFMPLWDKVMKDFHLFGRLSTFSYLEYLKIMGVNIECNDLFFDEIEGSKSHRNGMLKVLGRDDLELHKSNEVLKTHSRQIVEWVEAEAEKLLLEAKRRFKDEAFFNDVNYFTLESTLCCYKSWHRPNRRYANVYNDMFYHRIKKAETLGWEDHGIDFDLFWWARRECLPAYLRLEDNPSDPTSDTNRFTEKSLFKEKQNLYRETGEIPMMGFFDPIFENNFNKTYYK